MLSLWRWLNLTHAGSSGSVNGVVILNTLNTSVVTYYSIFLPQFRSFSKQVSSIRIDVVHRVWTVVDQPEVRVEYFKQQLVGTRGRQVFFFFVDVRGCLLLSRGASKMAPVELYRRE